MAATVRLGFLVVTPQRRVVAARAWQHGAVPAQRISGTGTLMSRRCWLNKSRSSYSYDECHILDLKQYNKILDGGFPAAYTPGPTDLPRAPHTRYR